MANLSYDELLAALQQPTFEARTDDQLQEAAKNKYGSYYDQLSLAQQQAYEKTKLNLQNQLAALLPSYTKQAEQAQKGTMQAKSAADRAALSRGMNRSSYNLQTLSNVDLEGNKMQNDIASALTQAQSTIQSQDTLAANQLAEMLAKYESNKAMDMSTYVDEQRQTDYEKQLQAMQMRNELNLTLAQLMEQQRQFDVKNPVKTGGGSGSGGKGGGGGKGGDTGGTTVDEQFAAKLLGFGGNVSGVAALRTLLKNPGYKPAPQNNSGKRGLQD